MKTLCLIIAMFAVALRTTLSFGQASQSEMEAFPIPPGSGFVGEKAFAYVGDYGYYTAPKSSVPGQTSNASDYKYVRYSNVDGKRVWVYGAWGSTVIPAASAGADACFHAHASYGVWGKSDISFVWWPDFVVWSGWNFLGGGGMSGKRNAKRQMRVRYEQPNGINRFPVRLGTDVSGLGFPTAAGLFIFVPAALQGINRRVTIEHAWLGIMQSAGQFVSGVFRAVIHHWVYSPMTRETQYAI